MSRAVAAKANQASSSQVPRQEQDERAQPVAAKVPAGAVWKIEWGEPRADRTRSTSPRRLAKLALRGASRPMEGSKRGMLPGRAAFCNEQP